MERSFRKVSLSVHTEMGFMPVVNTFVEESSKAFGLKLDEALKLVLASEEVFAYLCRIEKESIDITIEIINCIYYVQLKFLFDTLNFDPWAFNITANISPDEESSLDALGLLIAARSVDRFQIFHTQPSGLELMMAEERSYPETSGSGSSEMSPLKDFTVAPAEPENLKAFAHGVVQHYSRHQYPPDFRYPGKIADMVKSREYGAMAAADVHGHIGGGILWHGTSDRSFEFFGPYVFTRDSSSIAEALLDAMIGYLGKTEAVCLVTRFATPELPKGYFELLGSINLRIANESLDLPVHYRQLKEDLGCRIWSHPGLEDFLKKEYERLFFARDIVPAKYEGEERAAHSVFSIQFNRPQHMVTIRPVWDGQDAGENLAGHINIFNRENIQNIFFEIDLTYAWQANLAPALFENNFVPKLVLPYASRTDTVLFQYSPRPSGKEN